MGDEKLSVLNDLLVKKCKGYISMIATGSIAVGDPWIEGRSDRDILLIFGGNPSGNLLKMRDICASLYFDDSYNFTSMPRKAFGLSTSKYALSNRFRSKTLFGKDLVPLSQLPNNNMSLKSSKFITSSSNLLVLSSQ